MKLKAFVLIVVLFLIAGIQLSFAHPPSKIEMKFNNKTKILDVTVYHPVDKPKEHYIKKIAVNLNGDINITQGFTSQPDKTKLSFAYTLLNAEKGDKIELTARCNIAGEMTEEITVK